MSKEAFFLGAPVPFKGLCCIYPPTVKQVVTSLTYSVFIKMFTLSQEEIEDEFLKKGVELKDVPTPFEYLLNCAYHNKQFEMYLKQGFLFFIHEPVTPLYKEKVIVIGEIKDMDSIDKLRLLREEDYFTFQNLIREANSIKPVERPNPNEHPKIRAMKAKARYRDKVKAQSKDGLTLKNLLAIICCMGFGLNPLNIGELSYCAISPLMAYYQAKEQYETDVKSLLAGADSKKVHPKYWIRNLDDI